jgi:hypothetical protein
MLSVTLFLTLPTPSTTPKHSSTPTGDATPTDGPAPAPPSKESTFRSKLRRVDLIGAFTLVAAIGSLLLFLDTGGNTRWASPTALGALAAFLLFGAFFAGAELRLAAEPLLPARIVRDRTLLGSYLANFFGLGASLTVLYHVPLYAQAVRGRSASAAGVTLLPAILSGVVGSLVGGLIMQKTGKYYWLTVASYVLLLTGAATITLMTGGLMHSDVGVAIGS